MFHPRHRVSTEENIPLSPTENSISASTSPVSIRDSSSTSPVSVRDSASTSPVSVRDLASISPVSVRGVDKTAVDLNRDHSGFSSLKTIEKCQATSRTLSELEKVEDRRRRNRESSRRCYYLSLIHI